MSDLAQRWRSFLFILATSAAAMAAGPACRSPLPTYTLMPPAQALDVMRERARAIRTLSARCRVILEDEQGHGVELDGVLVARPPREFRCRAWKFTQRVFDLTVNKEGTWWWAAEREQAGGGPPFPTAEIARLPAAWNLMAGDLGTGPWNLVREERSIFLMRQETDGEFAGMECTVRRDTLTLERCRVVDDTGAARMDIQMDRYRVKGGLVLPARMTAVAGGRRVVVLMTDAEINAELPADVFVPPARAVAAP